MGNSWAVAVILVSVMVQAFSKRTDMAKPADGQNYCAKLVKDTAGVNQSEANNISSYQGQAQSQSTACTSMLSHSQVSVDEKEPWMPENKFDSDGASSAYPWPCMPSLADLQTVKGSRHEAAHATSVLLISFHRCTGWRPRSALQLFTCL